MPRLMFFYRFPKARKGAGPPILLVSPRGAVSQHLKRRIRRLFGTKPTAHGDPDYGADRVKAVRSVLDAHAWPEIVKPPSVDAIPPPTGKGGGGTVALWVQFERDRLSIAQTAAYIRKCAGILAEVDVVTSFDYIILGIQIARQGTRSVKRDDAPAHKFNVTITADEWGDYFKEVEAVVYDSIVRVFTRPDKLLRLAEVPDRVILSSAITDDAVLESRWFTLDATDVDIDI